MPQASDAFLSGGAVLLSELFTAMPRMEEPVFHPKQDFDEAHSSNATKISPWYELRSLETNLLIVVEGSFYDDCRHTVSFSRKELNRSEHVGSNSAAHTVGRVR